MIPALSIIIVSFNTRVHLERCLESLHQPPPRLTHDITVVDNASTDGSGDAARRFTDVRVIDAGRNLGFSAANNLGIRASTGLNVLLLNSDTVVPPGAIDVLMDVLARHPEAAVVGPRLVDEQGRAELSFGRMMTPWSEWRQGRLMRRLAAGDSATRARLDAWARQERWPDWVTGACLLVRRADAEAVGLLDERFFMYTEDVDFCAAIRARGGRVLFTPAAEVVHLGGRSKTTAPQATHAAYRRSHIAFYEKHHPRLAPLLRWYTRLRDR